MTNHSRNLPPLHARVWHGNVCAAYLFSLEVYLSVKELRRSPTGAGGGLMASSDISADFFGLSKRPADATTIDYNNDTHREYTRGVRMLNGNHTLKRGFCFVYTRRYFSMRAASQTSITERWVSRACVRESVWSLGMLDQPKTLPFGVTKTW